MITIGAVPYVNARPLLQWFEEPDSPPVQVVYDVPSRLPDLLDAGGVECVLASSFDAIRTPGRTFVAGIGIASNGPCESVRLFARHGIDKIQVLALDASSLTSNHLAQVIIAERTGRLPSVIELEPDIDAMFQEADACVLIGDTGMTASYPDVHVYDLGELWDEMTRLPFVWALWIGGREIDPQAAEWVTEALTFWEAHEPQTIAAAADRSGWDPETVRRYLTATMHYRLRPADMTGLGHFAGLLLRHGFLTEHHVPQPVFP